METKKISMNGNSPCVRLTRNLMELVVGIKKGDMVNVTYKKGEIIIRKVAE